MAEQESKKVEENNVKETSESEKKPEESVASKDETSDTTKSNDKSSSKAKSPVKETKGKKVTKKKEESEDEESSDDEELVGSLDAPLVVEGKRARKVTEFLSSTIKTPQSTERKRIEIPEGKGEALGSMPRVQFQLQRIPGEELKPLHRILFGRPGVASEVKKNIRLFNGFDFEKDSNEYKKKGEQVDRFTQDSMKRLCEILDIEKKGTKEEVFERVMDFLLCPKASGKPVPTKTAKKGSKKPAKKRKRPAEKKEVKGKSKKAKSEETVNSDDDSEAEEKEEDEKEKEKEKSPAKKAKTPKKEKETKKPAKKDKKVVAIKISPGNKAKKAKKPKEKKVESEDSSDEEPLSKKAKKSPPTDEEIVELVKEVLEGADLEKITMKAVCKLVYDRFPEFDLTDRKEFIKDSVKEIIT